MTGEGGPIMYDSKLRPVWVFGTGTKLGAADLKEETGYQPTSTSAKEPVLLWWVGNVKPTGAVTSGKLTVVNEDYRKIATLQAKKPWIISLHDASIVGPDIWVTAYKYMSMSYKGWKGTLYDAGIQEYNLKTGKLLRQWDALKGPGKIPLSRSYQPRPKHGGLWDAYHLNAIQALPDGNMLVSMRNTWSVYLLNPTTGKILWTLGGKKPSFKSSKSARFAWQHDAQLVGSTPTGVGTGVEMSLFNDDCTYITRVACQGPSEGMLLKLNTVSHKATLIKAYRHKPPFKAQFLGSMQVLPKGNALVGWGSPYSYFTEFSKSGKTILDVQWPNKDQSYRALFAPASGSGAWVGTPYYPPLGAAKTKGGKTTVYASWNGATEVAKWEVLAGSGSHLTEVASHSRSGFETKISLKKSYSTYEVEALDSSGHVLPHGTSKSFK
jgi:hypothetical protein